MNPKYIRVHFPFKSNLLNSSPFAEIKVNSDIGFGFSNKKSPFIRSSFVLRARGVVNLFMKRVKTVRINIAIINMFFLMVIS